jgi:hypothetical protein
MQFAAMTHPAEGLSVPQFTADAESRRVPTVSMME